LQLKISILVCLISMNLHAETWSCIASLENFGMPEEYAVNSFERVGDTYMMKGNSVNQSYDIAQESEDFILLTKTYDYPGILINILDKKNKTYQESYVSLNYSDSKIVKGFCKVIPDEGTL